MKTRILLLLFTSIVLTTSAQTVVPPKIDATASVVTDSTELAKIFLADQYDRGNNPNAKPGEPQPKALPGSEIRLNDDLRETRVRAMLNEGIFHTATDYFRAALVLQHSQTSDGFLLAHILAEVAVAKGAPGGLWLSAATLDRYLLSIHQKQVFGTQFEGSQKPGQPAAFIWSQRAIDPSLFSDAVRAEFCVTSAAEQVKSLPESFKSTNLDPCPAREQMNHRAEVPGKP